MMPVSKQQVVDASKKDINEIVKHFDNVLSSKQSALEFASQQRILIYNFPSNTSSFIKELKKIYEPLGWKIEYHSDQRDGSWITFE